MKKFIPILCFLLLVCGCQKKEPVIVENEGGVVYEIFVASFQDSNGDGIGDLNGVTEKLDYLKTLGVQQLWLMPIHPSASYHKYDVIDYYAIDESYGTMKDFERLIVQAKERNIEIIMDLVINHSSNQNPWFIQASANQQMGKCAIQDSKCDWYHFSATAKPKYTKINDSLYYESVFDSAMPDLNLDHLEVRAEIEKIVQFYLDKGVKGFRLDAPLHYYDGNTEQNVEFLSWLNQMVKEKQSDAYLVGEVWSDYTLVKSYYASGIDSFFDFSLSDTSGAIVSAIRKGNGQELARKLVEHTNEIQREQKNAVNALFLSNHDQGRSGSYFPEVEKTKLAAAVYLLSCGKPYIYYGEEIGMKGSGRDENKRMAMLWGEQKDCVSPKNCDYTKQVNTSVKEQMKDPKSLWKYYQQILKIRNSNPFLLYAHAKEYSLDDPSLFGMIAYDDEHQLLIIHNFSKEPKSFTIDDSYQLQASLDAKNKVGQTITIQGYSSMVFEKKQ